MDKNFSYSINISLAGKNCLIFGLGTVGRRKLSGLLENRPKSVTILDLNGPENLAQLDKNINTQIIFERRSWNCDDLDNKFLVFACSSDKNANKELTDLCNSRNILCDNVSDPGEGSFILPATVNIPPLHMSIGTSGTSPLLAARLKKDLENWLEPKALLAEIMGRLRALILSRNFTPSENREIFKKILDSEFPSWLEKGSISSCQKWLQESFPFLTQDEIKETFYKIK